MKVCAINGSPKPEGNTAYALSLVLEELEKEGIETQVIQVGGKAIHGCVGCGGCAQTGRCVFDDGVNEWVDQLEQADGLILPGVGAFPYAMEKLKETGLVSFLRQQAGKKPLLGICLGMQMLLEEGYEFTPTQGLGLISGKVDRIPDTGLKIPHMGWNQLVVKQKDNPLMQGIQDGDSVYFVHSYMAYPKEEELTAYCEYGVPVPAFVSRGNVFGAQFHPEKSGEVGLQILRNFGGLTR